MEETKIDLKSIFKKKTILKIVHYVNQNIKYDIIKLLYSN